MNSSIPARHEAVLRNQARLCRILLRTVWQKSAFYREYYFDHGIREHQLAELSVRDLPFITKKILMKNFDRIVTDARLRKSQIERWLNDVRDPRQLFHGDFIVMHNRPATIPTRRIRAPPPAKRSRNQRLSLEFG